MRSASALMPSHAVGLGADAEVDPVGGQRLEVGRIVERGLGVPDAALAVNRLVEIARRELFGSLEHHVLDPVGYARFPGWFVAATYFVQHPPAYQGGVVHLLEQDGHAIFQDMPGHVVLH
jgi:hypothetical protein